MVWHYTGQHCSSMYACTYRSFAGTWRPLVSVITTLLCCDEYFSSSSVVSRAFSALCVYSKFGHHPHPLGHLCAKFRFFHDLHYWARPWRKIAYSISQISNKLDEWMSEWLTVSHSLIHSSSLFDIPGTEAVCNELFASSSVCRLYIFTTVTGTHHHTPSEIQDGTVDDGWW